MNMRTSATSMVSRPSSTAQHLVVGAGGEVQPLAQQHHKSPHSKKGDGGFLLTCKLFCGMCGEPMTGDGGTSHSRKVYSYYTCNGRRKHKCEKERASKEWIEDLVVNELAKAVQSDEMIEAFADRFMKWQETERDKSALLSLEDRKRENEKALENVMKLIDGGFVTEAVKSHLLELEADKAAIEKGIAKELIKEPVLERDEVVFFLEKFRDAVADAADRQRSRRNNTEPREHAASNHTAYGRQTARDRSRARAAPGQDDRSDRPRSSRTRAAKTGDILRFHAHSFTFFLF